MQSSEKKRRNKIISRRNFLKLGLAGGAISAAALTKSFLSNETYQAATFIASVKGYDDHLRKYLLEGFRELGLNADNLAGKRVMLKPNLVEPHRGVGHINTHPLVVRAAISAFYALGAAEVIVAEGSGHRQDALLIMEESGLADVLVEDRVRYVDLNHDNPLVVANQGTQTGLSHLLLPQELFKADVVVSMAKMKTHHWAGVTLSMKNLFGLMPGAFYGWPKNVLHMAGIQESILDINTTVRPQIAIVDGIVGMEGDGPIMGTPVQSGVLVMGRNLPAVDATCARIMGVNPEKIHYLKQASASLGPIAASAIKQVGETIAQVAKPYALLDKIPAHRGLRLTKD
jgi:uncharacterized protein (DUF362 family)